LYEWRYVQLVDTVQLATIIPGSGPEYARCTFAVLEGECGDFDNSGGVSITDVTAITEYLYRGNLPAVTPRYADVNNDGIVNILDITYLIRYLLKGGPAPLEGCLG
jgi:hypothetical protein